MMKFKFTKMGQVVSLALSLSLTLTACGGTTAPTSGDSSSGNTQSSSAKGTDYPTKPITVLQGFKAGGGSDQLAQLTQPKLQGILGQSFVNQYIPGATGAIAWTQLTKQAKNDGYTLSITNTPMLMTNYIMTEEIKYNINELEPIANIVTDPGIIVVSKDSPINTYEDFVEHVKANPGEVTAGNSGTGGDDFFTQLQWMKETGLKIKMVPFEGDGASWQAAAGNKIDASFTNLGVVFSQIKAGNLKALAVLTEERTELLPDLPTLKELGVNIVAGSSRGYSAPKGIPAEVKEKLIQAFDELSKDPEFQKTLTDIALPIDIKLGDDYAKYLAEEEEALKGVWEEVKGEFQKQ